MFFEKDEVLYKTVVANIEDYNHKPKAITCRDTTFYVADHNIADFAFEGSTGMIYDPS